MTELKKAAASFLRRSIPGLYISTMSLALPAQDLPLQMTLDEEAGRLRLGGVSSTGFYDESQVRNLYLDFEDPDYWQYMLDQFGTENHALAKLTYQGEVLDSVAVAFKGQTSYTRPEDQGSEKLSFSVKLDAYIGGQDIDGYNNLNFNNAFQDPSFMREVLYGHLSREFVPALKGNFIRLWLNGQDWGLYPNIQQLNGDFIKEWFPDKDGIRWRADRPVDPDVPETAPPPPAPMTQSIEEGGAQWGDGTAALNYHGEDTLAYQQYYTLKDTDMKDPWSSLVRVCRVLNETPPEALRDSLEASMYLDGTLWFLAQEILFSDDDSYVHKGKMDYYLFVEEASGLMLPLEFDGNSAMLPRNSGWSPFLNEDDPNYPLLNRLLAVPELRQRYMAHVRTILEEVFDPGFYNPVIDTFNLLIRDHVLSDPKSTITSFQYDGGVRGLRRFMQLRKDSVLLWPGFDREVPVVGYVTRQMNGAEAIIKASAGHTEGIHALKLYYGTGLNGPFERMVMSDEGGGIYSASLPAFPAGSLVRYYIEAIAADPPGTAAYMPAGAEYDVFVFETPAVESGIEGLVINEIMASNDFSMADEAGEYDDWVEIHNYSGTDMSMKGFHLSDDAGAILKWVFPDTTLESGGYLVVWTDDDEEQGPLHASFKLSASGEEVILSDTSGHIIDHVIFGEQLTDVSLGRWPDALGYFQSMPPTFKAPNNLYLTREEDLTSAAVLKIYPNPCREVIHLEMAGTGGEDNTIVNMLGQTVMRAPFEKVLNVSELPEGLYLLRCGEHSKLLRKH